MTATDAATAGFREFSNPATGDSITFTATAEDGGEDVVRFTWRSLPGGSITDHLHPHQEERFTISAGEAHFAVNERRAWWDRADHPRRRATGRLAGRDRVCGEAV